MPRGARHLPQPTPDPERARVRAAIAALQGEYAAALAEQELDERGTE